MFVMILNGGESFSFVFDSRFARTTFFISQMFRYFFGIFKND